MKKPLLSELSLREKIGQLGVYRPNVCMDMMKENHQDVSLIGAVWSMGGLDMRVINMAFEAGEKQVTAKDQWDFMAELISRTKIPALTAMDSTRGLQGAICDLPLLVDPPTVGAAASEELAYQRSRVNAMQLKCAGAKWLWGPEEDLPNRQSAVSLGRKFSDDPDLAIRMAKAEIKGIQDVGVASTAKHFPGDDEKEYRDPHVSAAMLRLTVEEWEKRQGRVFQEMIDCGVDSVMIGHQAFPACDHTKMNGYYLPSTVSYKVVTELLKEKMGFSGVVVTDAIEMHSLQSLFNEDSIKVAIACINAGCDSILGVHANFIDGIEKAVLDGEIAEERIDDACQRMLDMKEKLGLFERPTEEMNTEEVVAACKALNREIAEKALSLVCDNNQMLPLSPDRYKKITIIYSGYGKGIFESLEYMKDEFMRHGVEKVTAIQGLPTRTLAEERSAASDLMLYVSHIGCHQPRGCAGYTNDEFLTFYHVNIGGQKGKRIAVSLGSPYVWFDYYSDFDCYVNAYNTTEETQRAFVRALYGEIPFAGGHPFRLIPEGFDVEY